MPAGSNSPAPRRGARPGFVLTYRGAEIGVVERIELDEQDGTEQLHVRGGISGGLAYRVPARAIGAVEQETRRAEVDGSVTFVPDPIGPDGLVRLSARLEPSAPDASERDLVPQVGARVRASDGPLGIVESLAYSDAGMLRSVVVRGRRHMRTRRFVVPVALLRPTGRSRGELAVDGTRRALRTR